MLKPRFTISRMGNRRFVPSEGFPKRLLEAILDAELTYEQVGLGLSPTRSTSAVSNWIRRKNNPTTENCWQLASLLKVNFGWLVYEHGDKKGAVTMSSQELEMLRKLRRLSPKASEKLESYIDGLLDLDEPGERSPTERVR